MLLAASMQAGGLDVCLLDFAVSERGGLVLAALSVLALGLYIRRVRRHWRDYSRPARVLVGSVCLIGGLWCLSVAMWEVSGRMLTPEVAHRRAELLLAHGHGRIALRWMEQAARGGHLEAQVFLAKTLHNGQARHKGALVAFVPQDKPASAQWYHRIAEGLRAQAEAGVAEAQVELGKLYLAGQGVEQDKAQATMLFAQAAAQQHPKGHFWYGWTQMRSNPEGARAHLEHAAALGEMEAYSLMSGLCLAEESKSNVACQARTFYRWAATGDSAGVATFSRHLRTLRRAAAQGDATAKAELATIRENGWLPARL